MKQLMTLALLVVTAPALADWAVESDSSTLAFTSTKNEVIVETHTFPAVSGTVSESGDVRFVVDLASVETNIPIRNERMLNLLFTGGTEAVFTTNTAVGLFTSLESGARRAWNLEGELSMNGRTARVGLPVVVTHLGGGRYQVAGGGEVDAGDFGYLDGLDALREIAGLASIAPTVSFSLVATLSRMN